MIIIHCWLLKFAPDINMLSVKNISNVSGTLVMVRCVNILACPLTHAGHVSAQSDSSEDIAENVDAAVDEEEDEEEVLVEEDQIQTSVCIFDNTAVWQNINFTCRWLHDSVMFILRTETKMSQMKLQINR